MMKPMWGLAAVAVGCVALNAWAVEVAKVAPSNGKDTSEKLEEGRDDSFLSRFTVGSEFEVDTAYVYHGSVLNDRPIASVFPYFDFAFTDDWSIGATLWVLNDLTNRRRSEGLRGEWNERDWELHTDYTIWRSEDEKKEDQWKLSVQCGYYWEDYTVHGTHYDADGEPDFRKRKNYPSAHYSFAKFKLDNPYITPFVNGYYEFVHLHSAIVETGVEKSFGFNEIFDNESLDEWSFNLSATLDGGHKRFLNCCYMTEDAKTGLACGEARAEVKWAPKRFFSLDTEDHLTFKAYVAYTGLLNHRIRKDRVDQGDGLAERCDHDQFVYGGLMMGVEF